jgi:hypothetical protein
MCVRTCCHDVRADVHWSTENLLDTDGRPDGNLGSDFSELEFAQNLPETFEIAFLKLVTL